MVEVWFEGKVVETFDEGANFSLMRYVTTVYDNPFYKVEHVGSNRWETATITDSRNDRTVAIVQLNKGSPRA